MPQAPSNALTPPDPPRLLMLGLSLAQGLALLWLWRAGMSGAWPSQTPALNFPLWAVAIVWPGMALLSVDARHLGRTLGMASAFTAVVALLAAYLGWQASPFGAFFLFSLLGYAVASLLLACFKALLYLQPWAARQKATYDVLFALSWRNFLVLTLAALAMTIFYAVLLLWGLLFSAIDIAFFEDLFAKDWFLFPVLTVAFGFGIHIFRRLVHLIDGIAGLLEGLLRLLLPLAVGVQVVFLAALPFTGLAPLWETGNGTLLLLCLNGLVLFAINAVYQTGCDRPYPAIVHRVLYVGIALLPAITALAAYGLHLRIDQHGWSVDRCWAAAVCAFFGLFSVAYAWYIVRRQDAWPVAFGSVNPAMGWLVLTFTLLVNSPLLDFRSISLASQWARVESGELALRDFDFYYAKENLARPGWLKMQALIEEHETTDPALVRTIRTAKPAPLVPEMDWTRVQRRPKSLEVPAGVQEAASDLLDSDWLFGFHWPTQRNSAQARWWVGWVGTDLDADGEQDYVLILASRDRVLGFHFYADDHGTWRSAVLEPRNQLPQGTDLLEMLREGEISSVERTVRDLKVGDLVLGGGSKPPSTDRWVVVESPD